MLAYPTHAQYPALLHASFDFEIIAFALGNAITMQLACKQFSDMGPGMLAYPAALTMPCPRQAPTQLFRTPRV